MMSESCKSVVNDTKKKVSMLLESIHESKCIFSRRETQSQKKTMSRSLFVVALVVVIVHVDSTTTAQITAQGNALSAMASAIPLLQYQDLGDSTTRWKTDPTNYYPTTSASGWCGWAGVTCDDSLMVTAIGTKTSSSMYSILSPGNSGSYSFSASDTTFTNNFGITSTTLTNTLGTSYSLTGTIPAAISVLTTLKLLDLAFNQLTGTLPSELGSLTALTHLNLGYNYFISTVPSTLSALTNLNYLFLNNTLLSGTIPSSLVTMQLYDDDGLTHQNIYKGLNSIATINSIKAQGLVMCSMTSMGTNSIETNTQSTISGINWVSCTGTSYPSNKSYHSEFCIMCPSLIFIIFEYFTQVTVLHLRTINTSQNQAIGIKAVLPGQQVPSPISLHGAPTAGQE